MHTATGRKTPASTVRAAARRSSIGAALCGTCGRETQCVFHEGSAGEPARWRARTLLEYGQAASARCGAAAELGETRAANAAQLTACKEMRAD